MHHAYGTRDAASSRDGRAATRRRLAAAIAVLLLAGLLAAAAVPGAQSAEPGLPKVTGSFPRWGADIAKAVGVADLKEATDRTSDGGIALAYPKLDRLYLLYNLDDLAHLGTLVVAERDMSTFALTRVLTFPDHVARLANGANGAEWVATFDYKSDRLYIAYDPAEVFIDALIEGDNALPGLLSINLRDFTWVDSQFPNFVGTAGDAALHTVGMEFDESTDTLLMAQSAVGSSSVFNSLLLVGWHATDLLRGGQLPGVAPRLIRACRRDPLNDRASQYLTPILVADAPDLEGDGKVKTWVMLPCFSTAYSTNVVIARLERASALDPKSTQEKAVVAPAGVNNWAVDQRHGRMYLVNNSAETDAWVYEAASNAFVGIVALSAKGSLESGALSLGVDEESGRLYGRGSTYGFTITAASQDPVPQADAYPRLGTTGSYRLLVDPKRHRVLSLPGSSAGDGGGLDFYEVISVPPPVAPPPRPDPDARTLDMDEESGRTAAQYGGNASAYGLRVLFARGVSGAVPSNGAEAVGTLYKNTNSYCGFTDRELVLARVSKTELSNTSRFARASGVDVDNATVIDLANPSRCDIYNAFTADAGAVTEYFRLLHTAGVLADADKHGPASRTVNDTAAPHTTWDYDPADCTTEGGKDSAGRNTGRVAGDTQVKCSEADQISASAEGRLKPGDGVPVSVSRATTSTKVHLDGKKGLVSTATARLEGVRIGEFSIGYITNTATAYAKGRKGSARTDFPKPKIGFVEGPGIPACTDQCDVDQVLRALNTALSGRAEFRRVNPEPRLAKGSPGGYEAGILKSEKQQASDNSLSGDRSVEIPALELVVYNDNPNVGRARQVYQLAGVRVDSHYGIQMATGTPCLTCGGTPGSLIDGGSGAITQGPGLPNGGTALKVNLPERRYENPIRRFFRQSAGGVQYGFRILFANPREAMLMGTVWALMWGPLVASRRRRALLAVARADPEGPDLQ